MVSLPIANAGPRSRSALAKAVVGVLLLSTAIINIFGFLTVDEGSANHLIVAVISTYLFVECRVFLSQTDTFGLLSPVFLATIAHFFLAYLLPTTGTMFDPWIHARFDTYFASFHDDIGFALLMAGFAAFCMWRGYYSGIGAGRRLSFRLSSGTALRREFEPNVFAAVAIQIGYFLIVSYAITLGVFGFSSTVETRAANVELLDIINLGLAAGSLSFLLLFCHLFRQIDAGKHVPLLRMGCILMVLLHLLVGALSGFKSQLVMPFVMMAMASFLVRHRISLVYVAGGLIALVVAYQIIEPYRDYLGRHSLGGQSDTGSMIEVLRKSYEQRNLGHVSDIPLGSQILQRFDLTAMSAVGLARFGGDPNAAAKGRQMAETIYLAPILAFTPRALWPDKPLYQTGAWFNQYLGNWDNNTSVGMGPTAWLYMVGGVAGIAVGFLCLGWLQAVLFEGFARAGAGGVIVYLAGASSLVIVPTEIGPSLVGLLRLLPIAFAAQYFLLRPTGSGRI